MEQGRCSKHQAKRDAAQAVERRLYDEKRGTPQQRGYTYQWARLSKATLEAHPYCRCGARATEVDHVVEIRDGGSRLDPDNLIACCHSCHVTKTYRVRKAREGQV